MKFTIEEALDRIGLSTAGLSSSYLGKERGMPPICCIPPSMKLLSSAFLSPQLTAPLLCITSKRWWGVRIPGLYYQHANQVMPGICPEFFAYHVEPELTFTMESYCGTTLSLSETTRSDAVELGRQCGQFMSAMSRAEVPLRGFGFLGWQEKGLAGKSKDLQAYWEEEANEYREQFEQLVQAGIPLREDRIRGKLEEAIRYRLGRTPRLSLTNRDISPENIIVDNQRLRLIDPLPLQYDDHAFSGNLLNNFNTLFPSYDRSPAMRSITSAATGPSSTDLPKAILPAMRKETSVLNIRSRLRNF